jgi:hypothetical protein
VPDLVAPMTNDAAPVADPERLVVAIRPLARSGRLQGIGIGTLRS